MPEVRKIRLKFIRSSIDPRSILVDEELNLIDFDEMYGWAKRKIDFFPPVASATVEDGPSPISIP